MKEEFIKKIVKEKVDDMMQHVIDTMHDIFNENVSDVYIHLKMARDGKGTFQVKTNNDVMCEASYIRKDGSPDIKELAKLLSGHLREFLEKDDEEDSIKDEAEQEPPLGSDEHLDWILKKKKEGRVSGKPYSIIRNSLRIKMLQPDTAGHGNAALNLKRIL